MAYVAKGDTAFAVTGIPLVLALDLLKEARDQATLIGTPRWECANL